MKQLGLNILAIFFPWIVLLLDDNLGGAIAAIIMQATCIGWIPASLWAWKVVHKQKPRPKSTKLSESQ